MFSPFVKRPPVKRRQSQIPSDLIDWDAPEIPELEKERIVYESHIKELREDYEIEALLSDQIFKVAHDMIIQDYQTKLKTQADELTNERSRINLLLGQIKILEDNLKEAENTIEDLTFKNDEATCEINQNIELYNAKKKEAEKFKKDFEAAKNQLNYYKKLAKGAHS